MPLPPPYPTLKSIFVPHTTRSGGLLRRLLSSASVRALTPSSHPPRSSIRVELKYRPQVSLESPLHVLTPFDIMSHSEQQRAADANASQSRPSSDDDVEKSSSEDHNTEGTFHQNQMGPKPKRKHFFSSLDPSYADAVHRDAASVEYSEEEEVCNLHECHKNILTHFEESR
jgi:hypothetical protein